MNKVQIDKSCGAVVFTIDGEEIKYILVEEACGFFSLPKGHVENDETEEETAIREIKEETGLELSLIPGFREIQEYDLLDRPDVRRQIVFFLAEYKDQEPHIVRPREVKSIRINNLKDTFKLIEYDSLKNVLLSADSFIKKSHEKLRGMADYSSFTIETKNLMLKKATESDLDDIYNNLWRHKESTRYMLWTVTDSIEKAKERLGKSVIFQNEHKYAFFVYEKSSGKAIGFAGMKEIERGVYEDTGIAVGPEFVGKGYGTEILTAFMDEARKCGAHKFVASCRKKNIASHKLMMKCGLSFSHDEDRTDSRDGSPYVLEFNEIALS